MFTFGSARHIEAARSTTLSTVVIPGRECSQVKHKAAQQA